MLELSWRKKNHTRAREYEKKYYYDVLRERLRQKNFGDRKCRLCEILLKSVYGGHNKKFYCDGCVANGEARRHTIKMASRRFRAKNPEKVKELWQRWYLKNKMNESKC